MIYKGMNEVIQYWWIFPRIDEIFEHAGQSFSRKCRYNEHETENVRSHNELPVFDLINKNPCNTMSWRHYVSLDGYNLNPVIHLLLQLIIGPEHDLVHISSGMTLELSYLGTKRPL